MKGQELKEQHHQPKVLPSQARKDIGACRISKNYKINRAKSQKVTMQDRIELDEELELEAYEKKQMKPLFGSNSPVYQKKAKKHIYSANQSLGDEIWPLFEPYKDIPPKNPKPNWRPFTFEALLGIIKRKGPQFIRETYSVIKEDFEKGKIQNPLAIFLWTIKNCKVELKEVELK